MDQKWTWNGPGPELDSFFYTYRVSQKRGDLGFKASRGLRIDL